MNRHLSNRSAENRSAASRDSREFVYRIDAHDCITSVNDDWLAFARENDSFDLTEGNVLGRKLWSFVADAATREVYAAILHQGRKTGRTITFPFRCDGPGVRRFMEMSVRSLSEGEIEFRNRVLKLEKREPIALLNMLRARTESVLRICGWCKRMPVVEQWMEVEDAIRELGLFGSAILPQLTHGICPECTEMYFGSY